MISSKKKSLRKKHFLSGMRTDRLPTVHASVATRCQHWSGGPQVNKFEHVLGRRVLCGDDQCITRKW